MGTVHASLGMQTVTAHACTVTILNVIHSLRARGLRRTLLFAVLATAIPVLGELMAVDVLKVLRHHVGPRSEVCRWPSPLAGTTSATEPSL